MHPTTAPGALRSSSINLPASYQRRSATQRTVERLRGLAHRKEGGAESIGNFRAQNRGTHGIAELLRATQLSQLAIQSGAPQFVRLLELLQRSSEQALVVLEGFVRLNRTRILYRKLPWQCDEAVTVNAVPRPSPPALLLSTVSLSICRLARQIILALGPCILALILIAKLCRGSREVSG